MDTRNESWLVGELQIELRDNLKLSYYRGKCREKINSDDTARMFDHFEVLISSEKLLQIARVYLSLLKQIMAFPDQQEEATLTSSQISRANHLLEIIICHGISELFDSEFKFHTKLAELLDLTDVQAKIHPVDVLCAYVGSIFQAMYATYPKSMADCHVGRQLAEKYINKNYKNIARKILLDAGFASSNRLSSANSSEQMAHLSSSHIDNLLSTTSQAASTLAAFGIYAVKALTTSKKTPAQGDEIESAVIDLL